MSLPTDGSLLGMGYAFNAQPFVAGTSKLLMTLNGMGYAFNAQPFVVNSSFDFVPTSGWGHKINGISTMSKINGLAVADISKVNGV